MKSLKLRKKEFAQKIIEEIENGQITSKGELQLRQFFWSKKCLLTEIPTRPFVLSFANPPSRKVKELLSIKPTRSLSGVQVIAVMLPPFPCPGECIYCPSSFEGKKAPKSYTGFEPSTLRAQRLNFNPYKIVSNRIKQLDATGNNAQKIELIFQGSSFTAMPPSKQKIIVKKSIDAVTGKKSDSILSAQKFAQKSKRRIVGITFETRPDICGKKEISQMLSLGGTRIELGVQNPDDLVYKKIKRGHTVEDVVNSTKLLKDSAFKVLYHLMPGLPGSSYENDLKNFKKIFSSPDFKPDMIKFYPCLVIKGSELYDQWQRDEFSPMEEERAVKLLVELKSNIPKWVRIMRVNRDIPSTIISAGVKRTNLRQIVEKELALHGKKCNCIRCREAGLKHSQGLASKAKITAEFYEASKGEEAFISSEYKDNLFGFVRLRKPSPSAFMPQISSRTALIRELHVYGKALSMGEKDLVSPQHKGLGKELMMEAERIAKEKFDAKKMVVISGIGVREYYKKNFGYKKEGPYMSKRL